MWSMVLAVVWRSTSYNVAAHAALGESSDDDRDEHQLDDIDEDENDNCVNTVNDDNDVGV